MTPRSTESYSAQIARLKKMLAHADVVVIGAGAGLSTAAGFTYSGERFARYFGDFIVKYHIPDMYSGGFYRFDTPEEYWAWWSRHIYYNRYVDAPHPVYRDLLKLVQDSDYFVLTTNVDHQFQRAGFDKERLFYTQGDYGLWQCARPCHNKTYDNEQAVRRMLDEQQGMRIPTALVPRCPVCGGPMAMNLRADDTFVEDEGWHAAAARYAAFLRGHTGSRAIFLELGVGGNTPGIIKYPFWRMTQQNPNASYVCINLGEAFAPHAIKRRSLCLSYNIGQVLQDILQARQ